MRLIVAILAALPAMAGPTADLAASVLSAGLDTGECYRVRDLHLAKEDLRFYLTDGYLIFGNPVNGGSLSSDYGHRTDPFHGNLAFHRGIDFAGPSGSDIVATGAGIVTFAGEHAGYG